MALDAVFVDGVPAKITIHDFRRHHLQSFAALADTDYDDLLTNVIDAVYAVFPGIGKLWDLQPEQIWYDKTVLCYRLLAAWFITDHFPELSKSYTSLNGVLLEQKKVDSVMLRFQKMKPDDGVDPMLALRSNMFGRTALLMIRTAVKRALLRNYRIV
jgi:hypothetical protein